ncbi:hypothetical protein MNAN1_002823 [Malassezia nana]|uniref:Uncharacterized protein n=1 Tax=Malassezia nana TaxID=180528 RepID=A0AAF0J4B3_9BASI|nr:hypothetical protein MNAN1_002823 [Malassezia nana]
MRVGLVAALLLAWAAFVCAAPSFSPQPTVNLEKRQAAGGAALGGGGGQPDTVQTQSMQSISGYTPPASSTTPEPSNFKSGKILQTNEINGYEEAIRFAKSHASLNIIPMALLSFTAVVVGGIVLL